MSDYFESFIELIDRQPELFRDSRLNNVPIIWLLLREIDCMAGILFLRESLTEQEVTNTRFLPSRDGGSIDLSKCLTLGEIFGLDLRQSRLTVLSACETGLTDFRSLTDEYIGLPSGFLYAGSPNIVSSLWSVNDLSTAFLMIKLYQNLQDNDFHDSVPIALNQAQLWLKNVTKEELEEWGITLSLQAANQARFETAMAQYESNSRPFSSPYYWAAFCAVGY